MTTQIKIETKSVDLPENWGVRRLAVLPNATVVHADVPLEGHEKAYAHWLTQLELAGLKVELNSADWTRITMHCVPVVFTVTAV